MLVYQEATLPSWEGQLLCIYKPTHIHTTSCNQTTEYFNTIQKTCLFKLCWPPDELLWSRYLIKDVSSHAHPIFTWKMCISNRLHYPINPSFLSYKIRRGLRVNIFNRQKLLCGFLCFDIKILEFLLIILNVHTSKKQDAKI